MIRGDIKGITKTELPIQDTMETDSLSNIIFNEEISLEIEKWILDNENDEDIKTNIDIVREFGKNLQEGRTVGVEYGKLDEMDLLPDWLDMEKLLLGQKLAQEFYLSIGFAEIISLSLTLCNDTVLRKLIWTGKSSEPYTSFKRYLTTGLKVSSWLKHDLTDKNSDAFKNIQIVNKFHQTFCQSLDKVDDNLFCKNTDLPDCKERICPFVSLDNNKNKYRIDLKRFQKGTKAITQTEMITTQFAFISLIILRPENFGISLEIYRKELEGFIHLWRYIGYRLGILDKYNLCSGNYNIFRVKSKLFLDIFIKPNLKSADHKWEQMTRSIVDGMRYYKSTFSYEAYLMFGFDLFDINYKQLYKYSSFISRVEMWLLKMFNYYIVPIGWIRRWLTKSLLKKIDEVYADMPTRNKFIETVKL